MTLAGAFDANFSAIAVYVIVGGSGRFEGASGSGTLSADLVGDTLHYTALGTISY